MPKKLEDCVASVRQQNRANRKKVNPFAVCVASTGLKPHKGKKKGASK